MKYLVEMPDSFKYGECKTCPNRNYRCSGYVTGALFPCPLAAAKPALKVDSINDIPNGTETLNGKPVTLYAVEEGK